MIVSGLIISFFTLLVVSSAINLNVPQDGSAVVLMPKNRRGGMEYRWDLTACDGCKMALECTNMLSSCEVAAIKIDDGQLVTQHCPDYYPYIIQTSWKNKMTIIIEVLESIGDVRDVHCIVKSTPPYLNVIEKVIDSSEHGVIRKGNPKKPTCKCGWANKNQARIVNGKEAGVNEYPFPILLIFTEDNFPFCGGSIITPYHVLTAAHCTNPYYDERLSVVVGEHDIRTRKETTAAKIHDVIKIYEHSGYDSDLTINDIAIVEVGSKIEYNAKVGPVCLPTKEFNLIDKYIKVMGWGLTKDAIKYGRASPVLMKVNLRVIDINVCNIVYEIDTKKNSQICTYNNNKDTCQGDSGGPLVYLNPETNMYTQVGIVSYGKECGSTDPAVNTNVAHFMPWIKAQLKKSSYKVEYCC
uniref:Venom S1 protease 35 n=1 Tax=Ectomocoris sp. TaxID=3104572 RepID=A0AB38ZEC7_9HEMI